MIYRATGWNSWNSSPDLANICCNVPDGLGCGYQYPATGGSYAILNLGPLLLNGGEAIGIELSQPLIIGQKYYVNFKANLCNNPSCNCGLDKLGALFTTYSRAIDSSVIISTCPFSPFDSMFVKNFAHVYSNQIIIDTLNWTTISGSFIADSTYQYVTIGLFFDNSHITLQKVDPGNPNCGAVYTIDDVYVGVDSLTSINEGNRYDGPFKIFPNPAKDNINISCEISSKEEIRIELYNIIGKQLLSQDIIKQTASIDISMFPDGLYFLNIISHERNFQKKFIKIK